MLTTNTISARVRRIWCSSKDATGPIEAWIGDINVEFLAPVHGWNFQGGEYKDGEMFNIYVYCHQNGQSGEQSWYAFSTELERTMFLLMMKADKVGPAMSLKILSRTKASTIQSLIDLGDRDSFKKLPGVGPKTGDSLIGVLFKKAPVQPASKPKTILNEAVVFGLVGLGYKKTEAAPVVLALQEELGPDASEEVLLRKTIQKLSKSK